MWEFLTVVAGSGITGIFAWMAGRSNWNIEKKRDLLKRRGEMVERWRSELLSDWDPTGRSGFNRPTYSFMERPSYSALRPHLTDKFRNELEGSTIIVVQDADYPRKKLMDEIARIEREWHLI